MSRRTTWASRIIWCKPREAVRGAWQYRDYLINEIEELKLRGASKHLSKLRKYLKRTT